MDHWTMVRDSREELAGLLDTLTPAEWDTQSLCSEWRVRDVVGHLLWGSQIRAGTFMGGMLASGFRFNAYAAKKGKEVGSADPEVLMASFREIIPARSTPPGANVQIMLADIVVHTRDICRPLGKALDVTGDRLVIVADFMKKVGVPLNIKQRIAGLKLSANDADWSTGSGPEVNGSCEALLMAMTGRRAALADLGGEGKEILASRG